MTTVPRGAGRARVVIFALALALLAACGGEPASEENPVDVLERGAARLEAAKSYRFLLEFEGGTTEIVRGLMMRRAEGTFAGVDNLDSQVLVSVGPLDARVGIRVVNGESWVTNPLNQRWEREQISVARLFDLGTGVPALMRAAREPRFAGSETIEGVPVRRIDGALPSESFALLPGVPPGQTLHASAWIGTADDLVRRLEVSGRVFAAAPTVEGKVRLTLSAFDEPVVIEAPR